MRVALLVGAAILWIGAVQPPDERAAARAFADAGIRYQTAQDRLEPRLDTERPERPCAYRLRRRIAEHRWDEVNGLATAQDALRVLGRLLEPPFTQLSLELHAVETADPALRGGRTAVRRGRRLLAALAALPRVDVCAQLRRWERDGFDPPPAMRRSLRLLADYDRFTEGGDAERRLRRATTRMIELGVPPDDAYTFSGQREDAGRG